MISLNDVNLEIVGLAFGLKNESQNRALVRNIDTRELVSVDFTEVKDEEEYQRKIRQLREFADKLDTLCYEPVTIRVEHKGRIWSGSVSLDDRSAKISQVV